MEMATASEGSRMSRTTKRLSNASSSLLKARDRPLWRRRQASDTPPVEFLLCVDEDNRENKKLPDLV